MGTKEPHQPFDLGSLTDVVAEDPADARHRMIGVVAAVAIHVAVLSLNIPISADPLPEPETQERRRHQLTRVIPTTPPPLREKSPPPKTEARREVPVPEGRTPDIISHEWPEIDQPSVPDFRDSWTVPEAPSLIPTPSSSVSETIRLYTPPEIIKRVDPDYPPAALKAGIEGTVVLEMTIDERGVPVEVKVLRHEPFGMTQAALHAARQWRFEPCTSDGRPVRVQFTLTVRFNRA
jgi:protein TonB